MQKKILITGATGFVGRYLIPKLVKKYGAVNLFCLVRDLDSDFEKEGRKLLDQNKIKYKRIDLVKVKSKDKLKGKYKTIIHLAAQTDTSDPDHSVNNLGTKNLYGLLKKLDKSTHFIHISTMVLVVGRLSCKTPINEDSKDYPTNKYTRTKLEGERFLIDKSAEDYFPLTILRPNTIWGKGFRKNSLFDMVLNYVKKGSIITRIDWPGRSALIHADDVASAIMFFCEHPPKKMLQKFLLYGENLAISDISMLLAKQLERNYKTINLPSWMWNFLKRSRVFIPVSEKLLPPGIYNYLWRLSIIVDNVIYAKSDKIKMMLPHWNPKLLKDHLEEITN